MTRTAELSWLQFSNKCTNVIISTLSSFPFLFATVICHDRPLLLNQSVWLSLNFFGRYFMAQSKTRKTEVSSSSSMTSSLDSSRFVERSECDFQVFMHCLDLLSYRLCLPLSVQLSRFQQQQMLDENIGRMCGCGCDGKFQGSDLSYHIGYCSFLFG